MIQRESKATRKLINLLASHDVKLAQDENHWVAIIESNRNSNPFRYSTFCIPKKRGGYRNICAPNQDLRRIQKAIAKVISDRFSPPDFVNGFVAGKNIVENAQCHVRHEYVCTVDLNNFFQSIKRSKLENVISSLGVFEDDVMSLVLDLCLKEGSCPQGAPSSPAMSNLAMYSSDLAIHAMCTGSDIWYSRYADDLTFSTNHRFAADFLATIEAILEKAGFALNNRKTRIRSSKSRQLVTGLIVNEKVNVNRNYIRELRAILHDWKCSGIESACERFNLSNRHSSTLSVDEFRNMMFGKISFLGMVRGSEDSLFLKFKTEFSDLKVRRG